MPRRPYDTNDDADTLRAYLSDIGKLPRMTVEEERQAAIRVRAGDEAALNRLVEANLKFVVSYAKHYRGLGVSFLDLVHEGNLGLIEAAHRFDPSRNVKFITYAVFWVRNAMLRAVSEQSRLVYVPPKVTGPAARLGAHRAALSAQLERSPTTDELADELDMSEADADALLHAHRDDVSLSDPAGRDDERRRELGDSMAQALEPPPEDALVREETIRRLRRAVATVLSEHEREIMLLRFGLSGREPMTLQEVGEHLHPPVTRERVRQLEERAKKKLRDSGLLQRLSPNA